LSVHGGGDEVAADLERLNSRETYLGYERTGSFASPGGVGLGETRVFAARERLKLNHWALSGNWRMREDRVVLNGAGGRILFRFDSRDVHLVLRRADGRGPAPFRVLLDGEAPGAAHGVDVTVTATGFSTTTASTNSSASGQPPSKSAPSRSPSTRRMSTRTFLPSAREEERCPPSSPAASEAAATTRPAIGCHPAST
jgi:hypothetical protein